MKLKNKVALVTGSSRGIGRATALLFAKEGAKVVVNYRQSSKEAEKLVKEINKIGTEAVSVQADISKEEEVEKLVEKSVDQFGKIDVLVNNAGKIFRPGDSGADSETWDRTLDVNLKGVWLTIKHTVPYIPEGGSIINIASYVGLLGSQYVLPYGAAKAGVINLTKAYAKELAPKIRVNSISPGNINTVMTQSAGEDFVELTIKNTPMKRLGEPEELAKAILFLASDDASFITGVNLNVDGGFLLTN